MAMASTGRRSSVCGSPFGPLLPLRCVSLPKHARQTLSGFLPYQPEETVTPQPRAHAPPPGRGFISQRLWAEGAGQNEG